MYGQTDAGDFDKNALLKKHSTKDYYGGDVLLLDANGVLPKTWSDVIGKTFCS